MEKDIGVLVDKITIEPAVSWTAFRRAWPIGSGRFSFPLLCLSEAISGVLRAVLDSPVQDRLRRVQWTAIKMIRGLEYLSLRRQAERQEAF